MLRWLESTESNLDSWLQETGFPSHPNQVANHDKLKIPGKRHSHKTIPTKIYLMGEVTGN